MKTIKSKIFIGLTFLFTVIFLLSLMGIIFVRQLSSQSRGTIVDNYSTVDYMMNMLRHLDDMYSWQRKNFDAGKSAVEDSLSRSTYDLAREEFEKNLQLETDNITEAGEAELVNELHADYRNYLNTFEKLLPGQDLEPAVRESILREAYLEVRFSILEIYEMNMAAILNRNQQAQQTARDVTIYMSVIGFCSIVITLFFLFTFPGKIVKPVNALTEKIKAISERNYNQQLQIDSQDEIGELARAFNIMAARLHEYEEKHIDQLLFEKKRMESLVQSLHDGVLVLDEQRRIVLANPTISELTHLKSEELLSLYAPDVAARNDLVREMIQPIMNAKPPGEGEEQNLIRIVKDNREMFFKLETSEIKIYSEALRQERFIGYLILLRNVTHYQERDTAKTNLLATVLHELKTPLSSINLSLKLLEDTRMGKLNEEQQNVVKSLRQQGNRLSRVIKELLEYSQIESGNIRLKFSPVRPDDVIDLAVSALMMLIGEKEIQLETDIEEGLPAIHADIEKTVWVLVNILSNAIRYSQKGDTINIGLKAEPEGVRFFVSDSGPGIAEEDQAKLFQRYVQVGQKSQQGWGLGLAISKEFVQAQGGKIWVESEVGRGSTFSFSLPRV
ncbi:MAG: HAMP domain-containing protein [Calditrichaceae bacterium]|nr:ATP-binding protein [Calditrichia bacterium]NUQ41112.1 HAMP domain-containing protein [Calditrichaceae bacterium]